MHVIDSHTGGQPTRVILDGGPDLGSGSLSDRARRLAEDHETFYKSLMVEPRGQPAMVGVLLVEPVAEDCITGAIFFDADAVLGMCGHGTIGLAVTLVHMGQIDIGCHKIETPAGIVEVNVKDRNTVTVKNIESRIVSRQIPIAVDGFGHITGDVAYGGNWFYIVDPSPIAVEISNIPILTDLAMSIRSATIALGIGGENGEPIDHVILQGSSPKDGVHSRNFVLCPDDTYDRSPCGTGSSARLACLADSGRLKAGQEIIQESVIGSPYRLSYRHGPNGGVIPSITGCAFVTAESKILFDSNDPFKDGILLDPAG